MPRSNRCRWILPFSTRLIPLPSPRLESIEMEFVEIFSFFSYHRFSSFFLLIIRIHHRTILSFFKTKHSSSLVTRFSIFTSYTIVCRLFGIPKSARRVEEEQGRRRERLSSKTAYFNVITISQLRPRHHRYQQDVRRRVKLTTAHVNEHR